MSLLFSLVLAMPAWGAASSGTAPGAKWSISMPRMGLAAADRALEAWAKAQRDEFLALSSEAPSERFVPYEFVLTGSSLPASGRLASVLLSAWSFTGGAHGNMREEAFLFETKGGRRVKTADLFKPGAPWKEELSRLCAAELRKSLGADGRGVWVGEGTKPTDENFSLVMVSGRELVVRFGAYQVAPYVNGPQTVRLPLDALRAVLRGQYLQF
ncbi:MAG: DUF3298 domain-containing protein [Elusimicrobia bacterium]|nr:DUF3298 domain-containing protein [Elusimicrobiota bacterium]